MKNLFYIYFIFFIPMICKANETVNCGNGTSWTCLNKNILSCELNEPSISKKFKNLFLKEQPKKCRLINAAHFCYDYFIRGHER